MKKISQKDLYQGQWIKLVESVFENEKGETFAWESIERQTKHPGVVVLAKCIPSQRFILVKQYRPPVESYILGFPSGLSEGDPEHALVELKEETGYHGRIMDVSPVLKSHAGLINDGGMVVLVEVDENDPANQDPQQELETSEDIEVFLIKKEEMKKFLLEEYEKGTLVSGNLWYLFILSEWVHS